MLKNLFKKENVLNFSCQSCGNCCRFFSVNITHLDIKRILENRPDLKATDFVDFKASIDKNDNEAFISTAGKKELVLKKKNKESNECIFLENNKCSIHSFKPLVCKVWPFSLEKGNITWIKEHLSFIRNTCKHKMIEGSNDSESLKILIKEHYKERKIFSKLIEIWNKEKQKEINKEDYFQNILDIDFLNFILREIEINKAIKIANDEDLILNDILKFFISNRRVELILESKLANLLEDYKNIHFNFIIYTREENIYSFLNQDFLNKIKENINDIKNIFINNKSICFLNNENKIILFSFREIHKLKLEELPFDTIVLYNPYKLEINILEKEIFKEKIINKIYSKIISNLEIFINFYIEKKYINAILVFNKMIDILYSLISINNYKYFDLNDIKFLNKNENLEDFFYKIEIFTDEKSLINNILNLINIFKKNLYLLKDFKEIEVLENKIKNYCST
jgi:Fe-S-cluster containining protein